MGEACTQVEPCAIRAADNFWAPPTFGDRRAAAADNLLARRRCHVAVFTYFFAFFMTKKGHLKILRIERNVFGNLWKKTLDAHAASPPPNFGAGRPAAADQNLLARRRRHNDVGAWF